MLPKEVECGKWLGCTQLRDSVTVSESAAALLARACPQDPRSITGYRDRLSIGIGWLDAR